VGAYFIIESNMLSAQIIPVKRLPISLPYLDYSVPKELQKKIKIGQLVKIPFRNKELFGVVLSLKHPNTKTLKNINEIVFDNAVLPRQQLDFLQDMAEFYHVSLGYLLKGNLMPLQKRKLANTRTLKHKKKGRKPKLFIYQNQTEKRDYFSKKITANKQTLILVPELSAVNKILDILPKKVADKSVIITSAISKKELFDRWIQIWNGEKQVVIGTRRALFLPWFNLKQIFLDDESNPNYKSWDMAPRFHTRDAALFLIKNHACQLHIMTHTPTVETFYFSKNKIYNYSSNDSKNGLLKEKIQTKIIDMRDERKAGNYDFISDKLEEEVRKIDTGDMFFFLNRRGTSNYVGCRDCGNVMKCIKCKNSLTYHQDRNNLQCHYCKISKLMPRACSSCKGINMVMYGVGTQLAETKIRSLLGSNNKIPIIRIDSDAWSSLPHISNEETETLKEKRKIIIGTQMAWSYVDWKKLKLLVFLDADTSLYVPEYKVGENLLYLLRDAQYKLKTDTKFLIQTTHPDHLVFTSLSNPDNFYKQELQERRLLGYPPFKFMLKLFYGDKNSVIAENQANQVKEMLINLTKDKTSIIIIGPLEAVPYFNKGKYWQIILLKIKYNNYKSDIKALLPKLPIGWKADPNPNGILSI